MSKWLAPRRGGYQPKGDAPQNPRPPRGGGGIGQVAPSRTASSDWGEDPTKWVIQKSDFGRGWCVFPPHNGEMWIHPTFQEAVAVLPGCSPRGESSGMENEKRCGPDTEYLEAVLAFHEPNTPPSTCMWCGLPSPCPPYLQAQKALAQKEA